MSISYEAHDWKKGDIITANDLKRFESGITQLINESETLGNAIKDLDVTDTEDLTKFVSAVNQEDGKIEVTRAAFAPSITVTEGTAENEPQFTVTVNTNPSSAASLGKAGTDKYGFTKLSNTIENEQTVAATPKAIYDLLGVSNGVATLDANGRVPANQLPSYVDDVLEYANKASFPSTGESGKIYIALDTNLTYRWSGSTYVEISQSLALGETSTTAYRGDLGAVAYMHAFIKRGVAFDKGLYKITTNSEGHVVGATAVTKADLLNLGAASSRDTILTTTLSCGRKASTEIGTKSIAYGTTVEAINENSTAIGNESKAYGKCSIATGFNNVAYGWCEHAGGYNNAIPHNYVAEWRSNFSYAIDEMTIYKNKLYKCISTHTSSDTFEMAYWSSDPARYLETIGNGSYSNHSNARVLDINGNEYLAGSLHINCDADSSGGITISGTSNGEIKFSYGSSSVTFTIAQLTELKNLLST